MCPEKIFVLCAWCIHYIHSSVVHTWRDVRSMLNDGRPGSIVVRGTRGVCVCVNDVNDCIIYFFFFSKSNILVPNH